MHDASLVALWLSLVIGTVIFTDGALTLVNRRVAMFWLRRRMRWRRWGWAAVATGLGLVLQSVAWLDGVNSSRLFPVVSLAGYALFGAGLALQAWARLPGTGPAAPDSGGWPGPS